MQDLQAKKMDEEALFAEMEVTGAAFEELQAQNGKVVEKEKSIAALLTPSILARLLEQLRDKDTANSRMMAETARVTQRERLLKVCPVLSLHTSLLKTPHSIPDRTKR